MIVKRFDINALNAIELAKKVRKVVRRAFKEEGLSKKKWSIWIGREIFTRTTSAIWAVATLLSLVKMTVNPGTWHYVVFYVLNYIMKSNINKRKTIELDEWLKSGKLALPMRKKCWRWPKGGCDDRVKIRYKKSWKLFIWKETVCVYCFTQTV